MAETIPGLKDFIRGIAPLSMRDDILNYLQSQRLA
jgi:hypothetical protein